MQNFLDELPSDATTTVELTSSVEAVAITTRGPLSSAKTTSVTTTMVALPPPSVSTLRICETLLREFLVSN